MLTYITSDGARICEAAAADYNDTQITVYGLSTDTKPVHIPNASMFWEMDTKMMYLFDAEGARWLEQ